MVCGTPRPRGAGSGRAYLLHLVAERSQRVGEFLQAKFQPRLHCSQRSMRCRSNFPVAESLEESQLQRLALKTR